MIRDLMARLKGWRRNAAATLLKKLGTAVRLVPATPAAACAGAGIVVFHAMITNRGKWYRTTGDHPHAPIFSLYTFFMQRLH